MLIGSVWLFLCADRNEEERDKLESSWLGIRQARKTIILHPHDDVFRMCLCSLSTYIRVWDLEVIHWMFLPSLILLLLLYMCIIFLYLSLSLTLKLLDCVIVDGWTLAFFTAPPPPLLLHLNKRKRNPSQILNWANFFNFPT